jgi:hypothetical protein
MTLQFDHLVHFLSRPPEEAAKLMEGYGFHTVPGGRHEHWGTCNSLSYFDLSYVEFLAVEQSEVARRSDNPLIRQLLADLPKGEGLGQFALRTRQMERWAKKFRERGLRVTGPFPGSRMRTDGTLIRWQMLFLDSDEVNHPLPFLIQWEQSDEERRVDLSRRSIIAPHGNGVNGIQWIAFAVADLEQTAARWQTWFEWEAQAAFTDRQLNADCILLRCPGGPILLCSPRGEGPAAEALRIRGERPFFVRFSGGTGERTEQLLGSTYQW